MDIFLGNDHLALLTLDGNLYTLGCAEQGQLGRVPEQFSNRGGRKGLGRYHNTLHIPLLSNDFDEFYLVFVVYFLFPVSVRLLEPQMVIVKGKVHFTDVFCGAYFTFAVSKEGYVYGFGLSNYHQLGQCSLLVLQ